MVLDMTIQDDTETYKDVTIDTTLNEYLRQLLWALCEEFFDILTSQPGRTDIINHLIKHQIHQFHEILQNTLCSPWRSKETSEPNAKKLTPSKNPWSSPIVLIDKKVRFNQTLRRLKKLYDIFFPIRGYPISRIDEVIQKHGDSNYLSRVDLSKEFWESELHEQSHAKSAFITLFGQYECTVMQFGMKTSSLTFDTLIYQVLGDLPHVVTYFADVIIFSDTFNVHLNHLREVNLQTPTVVTHIYSQIR